MVPDSTFNATRDALLEYDFVFSTNYDLLIYWAMMAGSGTGFKDYFWESRFDVANTEIWDSSTKVLYLHGALHLYYSTDAGTYKEQAGALAGLLELFGKRPDSVPLCITEGTARQKMAAIARSDYLSFALQQFGQERGPMVIFGHSLSAADAHLAAILARQSNRTFAIFRLSHPPIRSGLPARIKSLNHQTAKCLSVG